MAVHGKDKWKEWGKLTKKKCIQDKWIDAVERWVGGRRDGEIGKDLMEKERWRKMGGKVAKRERIERKEVDYQSLFTSFPLLLPLLFLQKLIWTSWGEEWSDDKSSVKDVCSWWSGLIMHLCILFSKRLREPFLLSSALLEQQRLTKRKGKK